MTPFTIDRSKHLTGTVLDMIRDAVDSSLYESRVELSCCLGLFCHDQFGVEFDKMSGVAFPSSLFVGKTDEIGWLTEPCTNYVHLDWARHSGSPENGRTIEATIAAVNDDQGIDSATREARLAELFAVYGQIELTFTGEPPSKDKLESDLELTEDDDEEGEGEDD